MSYSLNSLTNASEADNLLNLAQRDKRTLEVRKQNMALRTENSAEDSADNEAELTAANASLTASNAILATLPEGERKEDEMTRKLELELKIRKLTRNSNKLSPVSRIEKEYELELIDGQLATVNQFITFVLARKAEL